MIPQEFLLPYLVTNIISAALVFLAFRWPRLTRVLFVMIFAGAGLFNIYTAITEPSVYRTFKELAVLAFYRNFMDGFFSEHAQLIILIIAIAPLGYGSAFPATLLMVGALFITRWRLIRLQRLIKRQVYHTN